MPIELCIYFLFIDQHGCYSQNDMDLRTRGDLPNLTVDIC
jgi:hypothetical protein